MISTHILDTTKGSAASGVTVVLEKKQNDIWLMIATDQTNTDGRIVFDCPKEKGIFRLTFKTEEYFQRLGLEFFFMDTPVVFQISNTDRKYHVPLLLNPYGYSTYRGT